MKKQQPWFDGSDDRECEFDCQSEYHYGYGYNFYYGYVGDGDEHGAKREDTTPAISSPVLAPLKTTRKEEAHGIGSRSSFLHLIGLVPGDTVHIHSFCSTLFIQLAQYTSCVLATGKRDVKINKKKIIIIKIGPATLLSVKSTTYSTLFIVCTVHIWRGLYIFVWYCSVIYISLLSSCFPAL